MQDYSINVRNCKKPVDDAEQTVCLPAGVFSNLPSVYFWCILFVVTLFPLKSQQLLSVMK